MAPTFGSVVLADDRTGALETAALMAQQLGLDVEVRVAPDSQRRLATKTEAPSDSGRAWRGPLADHDLFLVVDVQTRHCTPSRAAELVVANSFATASQLHKIDSTLRGNWAHELVAAAKHRAASVVLVPAFPTLGRTCLGGVVRAHGIAVHQSAAGVDPLSPVTSSRPLVRLEQAGATHVVELKDPAALTAWLGVGRPGFAVCDAVDEQTVGALARIWADHAAQRPALFAGTAFSVAAAATATCRNPRLLNNLPTGDNSDTAGRPGAQIVRSTLASGRVLVVCGSLHPSARAQVNALDLMIRQQPTHRVSIELSPAPAPGIFSGQANRPTNASAHSSATHVAKALAQRVHAHLAETQYDAVVVIGGDTAAAVLGDDPVFVHGTLGGGTAAMTWNGLACLTRAGGFGDTGSLAALLGVRMEA